jgi:hypothetical protein
MMSSPDLELNGSQEASSGLGRGFDLLPSNPTSASLVLIAHALPPKHPTLPLLVSVFPVILTSLQSNVALDATLAILLKVLCAPPPLQAELSLDIIIPLTTVLPPLCSAHPDASTRHITFRILGRILQLAPSMLRLQVLRDLVSSSEDVSPHMRTAAIGLVKEAVLEALASRRTESVFSTPLLLQTIGPHVFRLDPPDILASEVESLKDSPEPARLVECLNLYYILLSRDVDNRVRVSHITSLFGSKEMSASRLVSGIPEQFTAWNRHYSARYALHLADGWRTQVGQLLPSIASAPTHCYLPFNRVTAFGRSSDKHGKSRRRSESCQMSVHARTWSWKSSLASNRNFYTTRSLCMGHRDNIFTPRVVGD